MRCDQLHIRPLPFRLGSSQQQGDEQKQRGIPSPCKPGSAKNKHHAMKTTGLSAL